MGGRITAGRIINPLVCSIHATQKIEEIGNHEHAIRSEQWIMGKQQPEL